MPVLSTYLTAQVGPYIAGFDSADKRLRKFQRNVSWTSRSVGRRMQSIGKFGLGVAEGFGVIGVAATGAGAIAVKRFGDYSEQLANVNTLARFGKTGLQGFSKEVKALSVATGQSKVDLLAAAYGALSAGIPREAVIGLTTIATQLAKVGQGTTQDALETMVRMRKAFPDKTEAQLANAAYGAVEKGILKIEDMGAGMGKVSGLAGELGVELPDLMAAISTASLTMKPEETFTAIRSALVNLMKPSENMKRVYAELGVEGGKALVKQEGLAGALEQVRTKGAEMGFSITDLIPEVRAVSGVLAITGTKSAEFSKHLAHQRGEVSSVADSWERWQADNEGFSLQQVKQQLDNIILTVGQQLIPCVNLAIATFREWADDETLTGWVTPALFALNDFSTNVQKTFNLVTAYGKGAWDLLTGQLTAAFAVMDIAVEGSMLGVLKTVEWSINKMIGAINRFTPIAMEPIDITSKLAAAVEGDINRLAGADLGESLAKQVAAAHRKNEMIEQTRLDRENEIASAAMKRVNATQLANAEQKKGLEVSAEEAVNQERATLAAQGRAAKLAGAVQEGTAEAFRAELRGAEAGSKASAKAATDTAKNTKQMATAMLEFLKYQPKTASVVAR